MNELARARYKSNVEKNREYYRKKAAERRVEKRSDVRAAERAHYEKNREKISARRREKYATDPKVKAERRARAKEYRNKNPEKTAETGRRWYEENKEKIRPARRNQALKIKYGISKDEYDALHKKQRGACAVCKNPEHRKNRIGGTLPLAVDHDHKSGRVRGLLCFSCNVALGHLKEEPALIVSLLHYLAFE